MHYFFIQTRLVQKLISQDSSQISAKKHQVELSIECRLTIDDAPKLEIIT